MVSSSAGDTQAKSLFVYFFTQNYYYYSIRNLTIFELFKFKIRDFFNWSLRDSIMLKVLASKS